ncbi:hypothetical protein G6F22_019926 [Rhizopus arrhizus]|nr:hypothetical protein G6F22_019926 [Rhizopus arrhizus]
MDGVVVCQQHKRAGAAGPHEHAEHRVVGIARLAARQVGLLGERQAQRQQRRPQRRDLVGVARRQVFQLAEALFARCAEVVHVFLMDQAVDGGQQQARQYRHQRGIRPGVREQGDGAPARAAKQ